VFIKFITGADPYFSILFFLVISSIYLIIGGLRAEIYVNIVQALLITVVLVSFVLWIVNQGDGLSYSSNKISFLSNSGSGIDSKFSWSELAFGLPIIGFWFWCGDQFIVQKIASAPNVHSVRKATLVSAFLQIIPIMIFISPGIIVAALFPNIIAEDLIPTLFSNGFLPISIKGGLIIAVAAALVSSFASLFNSTTVLITSDFYRTLKPGASDRKLVLVGRLSTLVLLLYSVLLVPISQTLDFSFCIKLFNVFCYFISLISAVFIIGLINKKIKSVSAFVTLCTGTVIILLRSVHELFYAGYTFDSPILKWFTQSGFLEYSISVFLFTVIFLFAFDKAGIVQLIANPFKRFLSKRKFSSGFHKKILFVMPALIIAAWEIGTKLF
jgi:SSS family solute:Na+ symporter